MTMSRSIFAVLSLLLGALAPIADEPQAPRAVDKGQRTPALAGRALRGPGYKQ